MLTRVLVLAVYFLAVLSLGWAARRSLGNTPRDYFLAGSGLGTLVLIGTMAATNFSAFTVFGASGAGYRDGLAFFPVMGFGTGFMALTFWLLGRRIHAAGRRWNLVTPAELVGRVYGHQGLAALFALVMVIFTVPYLALQPLAGGQVLGRLFGLPPALGGGLITLVILLYTLRGGLKAVAWTDVLQGLMMLGFMFLALFMVADHLGGWSQAFARIAQSDPSLLSRAGAQGRYTPAAFFSFVVLWFFCDPMFPQLFQRFYAAKNQRGLGRTMLVYPAICTVVFALPVCLGVLGRLQIPGLTGAQADQIVPLLMTSLGGDFMGTLVLAAGLAALMSTMDSQLLTLSSIFSRDLFPLLWGREAQSAAVGRIFVVGLALAGWLVAVLSDATILNLGLSAFTGLAVLFPTVFFGLYLKNPRPLPALGSILAGEALVLAYHLKLLPTHGFLPAIWAIAGAVVVYVSLHLLTGPMSLPRPSGRTALAWGGFAGLFILAQDFGFTPAEPELWWGWPAWAWWFVLLSGLQTLLMAYWLAVGHGRQDARVEPSFKQRGSAPDRA